MRKQDRIEADRQPRRTPDTSEPSQSLPRRPEHERMKGSAAAQPMKKERHGGKLPLPD